jgi:hypothetical protein
METTYLIDKIITANDKHFKRIKEIKVLNPFIP